MQYIHEPGATGRRRQDWWMLSYSTCLHYKWSGVCTAHCLANRHSCSTSAETRDRKCFSMQLILVVDMINQIWQMLSFCWMLLSAYFAEKKWLLSTLLSTVVTAKCACVRNTNVCFFQCMHARQVGQHFNLRPNFELWKRRHYPIIPTGMRSNIKGPWQPGHQCESFHWSIIYTVISTLHLCVPIRKTCR